MFSIEANAALWLVGGSTSLLDSCSIVFAGDFSGQAAAVQAQGYGVADGYLRGVAEDVAGGVGGDGIPAFEDACGAALFQLETQAIEAVPLNAENALAASG